MTDIIGCFHAGMIIFLVPFVGALTTHCTHFDMIHLGSYLSALSPLWIVAFPSHSEHSSCSSPLARLHHWSPCKRIAQCLQGLS